MTRHTTPPFWSSMVLLLLLFSLCSCAPLIGTQPASEQQTVEGVTIGLQATTTPKVLESQEFIITVTDADGNRRDDALVYLDFNMLADKMATNQPIAEHLRNGMYRATYVYTMSGEWRVTVVAQIQGADYRATFTRQAE